MNFENLHELINRYEENFAYVNDSQNDEVFKWRAVKRFQEEWFSPVNERRTFAEMFARAKSESSVLIDNNTVSPANGVVKLAEKEEDEVKRLFAEVLFADDGGNLALRQEHMDMFLEGMEAIRQKHFPKYWKYKQDRHSASCYLVMFAPEKNYIYKYSPVETFAQYIEFGKDIGSGDSFNLSHYHEMADSIVTALNEHPALLEKHFALLDEDCYRDESLHILAFDIIYCANTYGFFKGLTHASKAESLKAYTKEQLRKAEEEKKQLAIAEIEVQIQKIEAVLDTYRAISLVGVSVFQKQYGEGVVVEQNVNVVKVKFAAVEKMYIISNKFPVRPTFEDDDEIVAALTDYEAKTSEKANLESRMKALLL